MSFFLGYRKSSYRRKAYILFKIQIHIIFIILKLNSLIQWLIKKIIMMEHPSGGINQIAEASKSFGKMPLIFSLIATKMMLRALSSMISTSRKWWKPSPTKMKDGKNSHSISLTLQNTLHIRNCKILFETELIRQRLKLWKPRSSKH